MIIDSNIPFFSIIIPLYNKEKYIKKSISSVLNQSFINFEILVINDGSSDASVTIVESFKDRRIHLIHQKNKGVSSARNKGFKIAKGEFIALLDADDIWKKYHLQNFVNSIKEYPKEKIFCNNYSLQFSLKSNKNTRFSYLPSSKNIVLITDFFRSSLNNSISTGSTICFNHSILEGQFLFDETIKSGEDTDLWIRLGLHFNFVFNLDVSAVYNKEVIFSLSKSNYTKSLFNVTQKYIQEEKVNSSLKRYIDLNRFSIALEFKRANNLEKVTILKDQINWSALNFRQRFLLKSPVFLLKIIYRFKLFLDRNKIFFSVYS